jgi:hypothetical protein
MLIPEIDICFYHEEHEGHEDHCIDFMRGILITLSLPFINLHVLHGNNNKS